MEILLADLPPRQRYQLLVGSVVPRPIALVSSMNEHGHVNAAPFSYFNAIGADPPMVVLGVGDQGGKPKDTAHNIRRTHHFVVNLVSEPMAAAMNVCAANFPSHVNELAEAGLTSIEVGEGLPPRIGESPVSFLCREHTSLEVGRNRIILGEVLKVFAHDEVIDTDTWQVRTEQLHLIGRMHGSGWYARTDSLFDLPRPKRPGE